MSVCVIKNTFYCLPHVPKGNTLHRKEYMENALKAVLEYFSEKEISLLSHQLHDTCQSMKKEGRTEITINELTWVDDSFLSDDPQSSEACVSQAIAFLLNNESVYTYRWLGNLTRFDETRRLYDLLIAVRQRSKTENNEVFKHVDDVHLKIRTYLKGFCFPKLTAPQVQAFYETAIGILKSCSRSMVATYSKSILDIEYQDEDIEPEITRPHAKFISSKLLYSTPEKALAFAFHVHPDLYMLMRRVLFFLPVNGTNMSFEAFSEMIKRSNKCHIKMPDEDHYPKSYATKRERSKTFFSAPVFSFSPQNQSRRVPENTAVASSALFGSRERPHDTNMRGESDEPEAKRREAAEKPNFSFGRGFKIDLHYQ